MAQEMQVVCFGDSNTHGTCPMAHLDDVRRFDAATRWTGGLRAALPDGYALVEEGHPGRMTVHSDPIEGAHKNGIASLPVVLESHRPIALVIIKLGTNDLKARLTVTAQDIALSAGRLVDVVLGSDSGPRRGAPKVLLVAPPPIEEAGCLAEMFAGGAAKSRRVAAHMAREAEARGVGFLDAGREIAVSGVDGIHYEAEAHAELGRAIAAAAMAWLD